MAPQTQETHKVVIVGGSLVGLSTALCLAAHNIPVVVIERQAGSSLHPRAMGYTPRTMEIYHSLKSMAAAVQDFPGVPKDFVLRRARVESLAGKWFDESKWSDKKPNNAASQQEEKKATPPPPPPAPKSGRDATPWVGTAIAQDRMEAALREAASQEPIDLRYNNMLLDLEQDKDGVTLKVKGADNNEYSIRADYVIAADGHRSSIREKLGIQRDGRGHMQTTRSVLFRMPGIEEYLSRGVMQWNIEQPDFKAFLTHYADGRWVLMFSDDNVRDEEALIASIRKATGRDDLPIEIITTGRWELTALVAEKFQSGRIFLAGDSAHTLPPNRGGYGANTGIADGHNLAWKLAAVIKGAATPDLLESYDAERRPVALLRHQQIFARQDYKAHITDKKSEEKMLDDEAVELGQLYRSKILPDATEDLPVAQRIEEWAGQPGTRAPYIPLKTADGKETSTLDLFIGDWVLLSENQQWKELTDALNSSSSIEMKFVNIGGDIKLPESESQQLFQLAFGISTSGAVLVRPDGVIAWRTQKFPEQQPLEELKRAFEKVSCARKI